MHAEGCCERSQDLRATRRVSGVCGFGVECGGGAWIRRVFRDQPDSSCPQPTASALFSLSSVSAAGGSLAFAAPCSAAVHAGGWFRAFSSGQRPVVPIRPPKVRPGDPAMMAATQSTVKVACLQLACGADKKQNVANAAAKISEAADMGAELVVLPECFNSPYGGSSLRLLLLVRAFEGSSQRLELLAQLAPGLLQSLNELLMQSSTRLVKAALELGCSVASLALE